MGAAGPRLARELSTRWSPARRAACGSALPALGLPRLRAVLRLGSWIRPAGVSPVPVGAGAPGSRPRSRGETLAAERGVKSLFGGSKRAGCDCSLVKVTMGEPIAHFTAKAMSASPGSGLGTAGPLGVRGVARAQGLIAEQGRPVCLALSAKTVRISRWRSRAEGSGSPRGS